MVTKKRGLGRGLDALLGGTSSLSAKTSSESEAAAEPEAATDTQPAIAKDGQLREIPVEMIQRGRYQPRVDMHLESLDDLADSIRAQGVVQPIVVRPIGPNAYEIIAGERRWRAAQLAGLHDIPAVVKDVPDRAAIAMALIENIQRENLNPMEEARALQRLIDEFELTQMQAAEAVGRSRSSVANLLRLLDLQEPVREYLEKRRLEMGHARALLALSNEMQIQAADMVIQRGLTVRETEQLVRKLQTPKSKKPETKLDPNIRRLQDELSEKLGAGVQIQHSAVGKGKLIIQYTSLDELDGILDHIQ